jgi:hypothetical protein
MNLFSPQYVYIIDNYGKRDGSIPPTDRIKGGALHEFCNKSNKIYV